MNKRILLVNPWIHDFAAYDFWAKPLGLLSLAALLRQNGFTANYIECMNPYHPGLSREPLIQRPKRKSTGAGKFPRCVIPKPEVLKDIPKRFSRYGITPRIFRNELETMPAPDLIFVTSMMTYWYPGVFEAIGICKEMYPAVPVVLGGNYATLCHDHALKFAGADLVVTGEGEQSLPHVLEPLLGETLFTLPDRNDLDSYPYPAFDLVSHLDQVPIMTSRGCPYHCTYCASNFLNDGFRTRDPIKVVDEIEYWHRTFGVRNFSFYDDALLVNAEDRAIPMLQEIINRQLDCDFHCPNGLHLRGITEEVATLMRRTRFRTIRFGFETASLTRQKETGGKITNSETAEAVMRLKKAGYATEEIGMYILCGLPGQTAEEVEESIHFVKDCGARPVIAEYSPIPHTVLWEESVRMSPFDITHEPLFHNNTLLPCRWEGLTYDMYRSLKMTARKK